MEDDFTNIIHIKITKDRNLDLMHELETLHKKLKLETDIPEIKETKERKTIIPTETIIEGKESLLEIDDIKTRLPEKEKKVLVRASAYYMNNREIFINFISSLFEPYKEEISKDKGGDLVTSNLGPDY